MSIFISFGTVLLLFVTYTQKLKLSIDDIVQNLTSANLISTNSSSVAYKVVVPNGKPLAMKKMWSKEDSGAFESPISGSALNRKGKPNRRRWGLVDPNLVKPIAKQQYVNSIRRKHHNLKTI